MLNDLFRKGFAVFLLAGLLVGCGSNNADELVDTPQPAPTANMQGQVVFSAKKTEKEDYELFLFDIQSGLLEQLTDNEFEDIAPDFSPGGTSIAYSANPNGVYDLFEIDLESHKISPLVEEAGTDKTEPAWSPDGKFLSYQSNAYGDNDIFILTVADGTFIRITEDDSQETQANWQVDGKSLVFVSDNDGDFDVNTIPVNSATKTMLTTNDAYDASPVVSPDGEKIAFLSKREGSFDIYMMDADGSNERMLVQDAATNHSPEWSPDGSELAFVSDNDSHSAVYLVKLDSGEIFTLLEGFFHYAGLTWRK